MSKEKKISNVLLLLGCVLFVLVSLTYSQTELQPLHKRPIISIVGRLAIEKHGQDEWLVLYAKNAEAYLIIGDLKAKLKNSLTELGENNLVFVTGNQDGRSNVSCEQSYKYEYDKKGEKKLKIDVKCIRYYNLEVTHILFAKKSDEEIPPPKRDIEEERRLTKTVGQQPLMRPVVGEIYGTVSEINLKSPIKTVEIFNQDKDNPIQKVVLVISPDTRIVKKIGNEEPIALSTKALKTGQEVTAVYFKGELKNEALYITITKD
ncbi:MAG: DUF502 domain-containing protein [Candidatus Omnitrophica bacterium]|nr:DUF502 domain-containing protein [Candidatus Omnitrophota bacterium]